MAERRIAPIFDKIVAGLTGSGQTPFGWGDVSVHLGGWAG
jgi:hypothetical protein